MKRTAILKHENAYVVVEKQELRDGVTVGNCRDLIAIDAQNHDFCFQSSLYAGRVRIETSFLQCRIIIDGITITNYSCCGFDLKATDYFTFSQVAAFLNQIENLGVDSFLENYKKEVQKLKAEFDKIFETLQLELSTNDDEKKRDRLNNIRYTLSTMSCILFSLFINMNAGLENNHYINAYDSIISMYY